MVVRDLRQDFPMLKRTMHGKPLIFLDTAATAQKPQVVIDTLNNFFTNEYSTVHRSVYELTVNATQLYQQARCKMQRFLNAQTPEEIIFTRGTTESINMIAYSFGKAYIKPGDEVIISQIEHHSNIVPWQIMCEDRGAKLKIIPVDDHGDLILEEYETLLTPKTKIVAIGHISNALGTLHPVEEVIRLAHENGSKVLLDGAQAAPQIKVDVQELDVDFYVFSGHKTYGPTGVGVLYGKRELLEEIPPCQGGGDMIEKVTFEKTTYNDLPLKFEAGTPMAPEAIALGAAIDYMESVGREYIFSHEQQLLQELTSEMEKIPGVQIVGTAKQKGAVVSFNVEGIHHLDIGTMLDLRGLAIRTGHHCAQPAMDRFGITGTARVSFGLYNTSEDIHHFLTALNEVIDLLK